MNVLTHSNPFGDEHCATISSACTVTGQLQKSGDTVVIDLGSTTTIVTAQLLHVGNGTIFFEVSVDGSTWYPHAMTNVEPGDLISSTFTNVDSVWSGLVAGWKQFRVRASTPYSGTFTDVTLSTSEADALRPAFRPPNGYQAAAFDWMIISTVSGPWTIFLDPHPHDLDRVRFEPSDDSWGNPYLLTINAQGQAINGAVQDLLCDVSAMFEMVFYAGYGWRVVTLRGAAGAPGAPGASSPFRPAFRPLNGYTAIDLDHMVVSTFFGPMTIKLTATPNDLNRVMFEPPDNSWGNPNLLTIDTQGKTINGTAGPLLCDISAPFQMVWYADQNTWRVQPIKGNTGASGPSGPAGPPGMTIPSFQPTFIADSYTMLPGDVSRQFVVVTGTTDKIIILPDPNVIPDGQTVSFYKEDTGVGVLIIKDFGGATDNTHLMTQGDFIRLRASNIGTIHAWHATDTRISPVVRYFESSGTWLKRPRLSAAQFLAISGGGGGGSGRRGGAANQGKAGGGAGGAGTITERLYARAQLPSPLTPTVAISIGPGGVGGAAQTADNTNGINGTSGSDILITNILRARPGSGGSGGTTVQGNAGNSAQSGDRFSIGVGGQGSSTGAGAAGTTSNGPGAGGGGGGVILTTLVFTAGGAGGRGSDGQYSGLAGGTGGATAGASGNNGLDSPLTTTTSEAGSGGGGGAGNPTGPGGAGGDGGLGGGAGGGGGGVENGFLSGKGGDAKPGRVIITEYYDR